MNKHGEITAVYCRVALTDEAQLHTQEKNVCIFAQEQGYDHITVYADNGYSGLNFDRPEFAKMESDISDRKVKTIIVRDMTRISRNLIDMYRWIDNIKDKGIDFIVADAHK